MVAGVAPSGTRSITDAHRSPPGSIDRRRARTQDHGMSSRLLLPLFVCLWSSGYVVGAVAIRVGDPLPLLFARFTLAALVGVPLALRRGRWRGAPLGRLAVVGV